jgi:uncharacterized protein
MLISIVRRVVEFCSRHPWPVVAFALLLSVASAIHAATHFAITTDVNKLISPDLDWRKRELALEAAFPGPFTSILIVVDAPTPELATHATSILAERLEQQTQFFHAVHQLDGGTFFAKNGLLFQSEAELTTMTKGLGQASPISGTLAGDPTLRGLTRALSFGFLGVQNGATKLDDMVRPLTMSADTVDDVLAGRRSNFSWRLLLSGQTPEPKELRHFIEVQPVLDYAALEPGRAASNAIRKATEDLKLAEDYRARVRLTGAVAMADDEYSTVKDGAFFNAAATIAVVLLILWLRCGPGASFWRSSSTCSSVSR